MNVCDTWGNTGSKATNSKISMRKYLVVVQYRTRPRVPPVRGSGQWVARALKKQCSRASNASLRSPNMRVCLHMLPLTCVLSELVVGAVDVINSTVEIHHPPFVFKHVAIKLWRFNVDFHGEAPDRLRLCPLPHQS